MALILPPAATDPDYRFIRRRAKEGQLRRLYWGVFTDNLVSSLESINRREVFALAAVLAPGAIISHRSALGSGVPDSGLMHLTGASKYEYRLQGLTLRVHKGPAVLADDARIPTSIAGAVTYRSSNARALLENLELFRRRAGREPAPAGRQAVEKWLVDFLSRNDEAALTRLSDQARSISIPLQHEREYLILDAIISALLGTPKVRLKHLQSLAGARALPVDAARVDLFAHVARYVNENPPRIPRASDQDPALQAFVESYFSKFIDGTRFEIPEAYEIVHYGEPLQYREKDSLELFGTFNAITTSKAKPVVPDTSEAFESLLKKWNREVIFARPYKKPGEWKTRPNEGENGISPELVRGTLLKGLELIAASPLPEARAALAVIVVSEIQPFTASNGCVSRLLMNLILSAARLTRIIIPTVCGEEYSLSLKALSHDGHADPYIRLLSKAARFSTLLDYSSHLKLFEQLEKSNAMLEPAEAILRLSVLGPGAHAAPRG